MDALAQPIGRAACDSVAISNKSLLGQLGQLVGLSRDEDKELVEAAIRAMGERLENDLTKSAEHLITIHDLKGSAAEALRSQLSDVTATKAPLDPRKAAGIFGVLSGAASGLGADLISGGLTFGGGMLVGAVLGALGAAGVAQGVNVVRGTKTPC